ncbi:hypothetical protein DFA_00051 [Cavenderia fasciculata]|uniref:Ankyrin repeat-containing protein n=1 Tax=Cavenderia fasciculata TaxID=261658 RepID=F4PXG4_CACFS|nr:uncharacterized protein DFA_00051 [Cavenderia fasciculata]EGG19474.1 hypothetical protein DFA_00051 [Cavenderia fasciculata]|eukprot:XP_004357768.1 hypothetical protein DFA_00051 [Cavenderia fasciculata]
MINSIHSYGCNPNSIIEKKKRSFIKGSNIINVLKDGDHDNEALEMIAKYGLPWQYVKHYIATRQPPTLDDYIVNMAISQYCCHTNSTLETLQPLLKWCCLQSPLYIEDHVMDCLASNGNLAILTYLDLSYPDIYCSTDALDIASSNGYLHIVSLSCQQ